MGSAIAEQLKSDYQILVFDKDKNKTKDILNIKVARDNIGLLSEVDAVILAVKPQDFDSVLNGIKDYVKNKFVISIAAGISTGYIENKLGDIRVVRAMPNLPAKVGQGMICLTKGKFCRDTEIDFTRQLFNRMGHTLIIEEHLMNAATAISGSGPGFFYDFIETQKIDYHHIPEKIIKEFETFLAKAAMELAFNTQDAAILANATVAGSVALLNATELTPADLKKQVASEGGTTEAGLKVLASTNSISEAAKAAFRRAEELSKNQ